MAFVVSVDWIFSVVVVVVVPVTWTLPAFLDLEAFLVGAVSAVSSQQDDPLCCRKNISHSFTFYTSKEKLQASLIVQRRVGTSLPSWCVLVPYGTKTMEYPRADWEFHTVQGLTMVPQLACAGVLQCTRGITLQGLKTTEHEEEPLRICQWCLKSRFNLSFTYHINIPQGYMFTGVFCRQWRDKSCSSWGG